MTNEEAKARESFVEYMIESRRKHRVIICVEGGIVQNVATSETIDYAVLDHDRFDECARTIGPVADWTHAADCPDHTAEEWADYIALCREADALDGVTS